MSRDAKIVIIVLVVVFVVIPVLITGGMFLVGMSATKKIQNNSNSSLESFKNEISKNENISYCANGTCTKPDEFSNLNNLR